MTQVRPPRPRKPLPHEHKEIARGSGPAAILLFLHIAVIGYLGYVVYFLLEGNQAVFWNLVPFRAAAIFYFPASFALLTAIPTDSLTRNVSRIAQVLGVAALLVYGGGLTAQALPVGLAGEKPGLETACAIAAGIAGALLARLLFSLFIKGRHSLGSENTAEKTGI